MLYILSGKYECSTSKFENQISLDTSAQQYYYIMHLLLIATIALPIIANLDLGK